MVDSLSNSSYKYSMISVFISHNYMDKPLARKLSNTLNGYGIRTWIDEAEIKIGDSLISKINTGISQVDYIIAIISKYSVESKWVLKELDIAMNREIEGKKVVVLPILAGECNFPDFLKGKFYVDMSNNKLFLKNLPQLLSRFDIENVLPEKELSFTEQRISLFDIINKLSDENESIRINTWESLTYSDKHIFKLDEFRKFIMGQLHNNCFSEEELIRLLKMYDWYFDDDILLDSFYCSMLNTANKKLLQAVIHSINIHKTNSENVVAKLLDMLKTKDDNDEFILCMTYFYNVHIYDEKDELLEICDSIIGSYTNTKVLVELVKIIFFQFSDDDGIRRIIELYTKSEDGLKKEIVAAFSLLGSELELVSFYIRSPRLRDRFKSIILESFSEEDDLFNANLICALFVADDLEYLFPRNEIWDVIDRLDNYSIIALLEKLSFDYNVSNIFYSDEDVIEFGKMIDRDDSRINGLVLDILADIPLKKAIDFLNQFNYEPRYYNVDSLLITLLKETNICDYKEFYFRCRKVKMTNCDEIEKILISLCDYMLDNSKEFDLVSSLQIDLGELEMGIRQRSRILRFICDVFEKQSASFEKENIKKINNFIKKSEKYYKRT